MPYHHVYVGVNHCIKMCQYICSVIVWCFFFQWSSAAPTWWTGHMTPTPFPSLQACASRTARVLVELRGTLILDMCVQVVEALGQLGKRRRAFSGAVRLELSTQPGGVQLVHRCLSEEETEGMQTYPLGLVKAFECKCRKMYWMTWESYSAYGS